jgi:hypothetical protein
MKGSFIIKVLLKFIFAKEGRRGRKKKGYHQDDG